MENAILFLIVTRTDSVREEMENAMANSRDILRGVMVDCGEIALDTCADMADGFLNPPAFLADCFS